MITNFKSWNKAFYISLALFFLFTFNYAVTYGNSTSNQWISTHFDNPQDAPAYFSFVYNGKHSTTLLENWKITTKSKKLDSDRIQQTTEYLDPTTGLLVRSTAIIYLDFSAVEWVLHFSNTSDKDTPILEQILPLNSTVVSSETAQFTLHTSTGDYNSAKSYFPSQTILKPDSTVTLAAHTLETFTWGNDSYPPDAFGFLGR